MKQVFLLLLVTIFAVNSVFAQSGCDNNNRMKSIPATIDNNEAKFARTYWAKRCACESGAITGGTWDYSVEIMNNMYDLYQKPSTMANYKGQSFPIPDKRMSVSDCKNGNNFNITPNISDCTTSAFDKSKDPQQYGNAYMLARCECEKGVATVERAKQLEATMKINFQNAKTYYGSTLGMPQPLTWTACPIIEFGGIQGGSAKPDRWAMYSDDVINDDARSIIGMLAEDSHNPDLKRLSTDLNNLSTPNQQLANYNDFFNITPTQADMEFQQVMTNVAQGVAVAKFLVNSISRKVQEKKEKEQQRVAWEKKQGEAAINRIRNNLWALHKEAAKVPSFAKYNETTLEEIDRLEEKYYSFDIATAPERKFLIDYYYGNVWYNVKQVQNRVNELTNMNRIALLKEIDGWQKAHPELANSSQFDNSNAHAILANADVSFFSNTTILDGYRIICYTHLGETEKAAKLQNNIDLEAFGKELMKHLKEAAFKNDQSTIDYLIPQLRVYLELKRLSGDLSTTDMEHSVLKKILNEETVLLYANGIRISIENGDMNEAEANILFIKQGLGLMGEEMEYRSWELEKISVIETLEAMILIKKGKLEEGKAMIDQAIARGGAYSDSKFWKYWIKFNLLVEMKDYDAAHLWYNKIIDSFSYTHHSDAALFDINELKYAKCQLLFEQGEYKRVLIGLGMLEVVSPNSKYNQLRYKVYLKQGLKEKADLELEKIK